MATSSSLSPSKAELKNRFSPFDIRLHPKRYHIQNLHKIKAKEASTLIPLFYKNGDLHVLLTLRSTRMSNHAGQVAFPGGMKDENDVDDIETALRETEEEVGITRDQVEVICVLPKLVLSSLTIVTPVLGVLSENFKVVPNPHEVSLVFDLPLKRFLSDEGLTIKQYGANKEFTIYYFADDIDGQIVNTWGMTGSTCLKVAVVALQSDLTVHLSRNRTGGKEDCFNTVGTSAFVDILAQQQSAKL